MTAHQPDGPPVQPRVSNPMPFSDDGVQAQLSEVRVRLLSDAAAAGVSPDVVNEAVTRTAEQYTDAPVRSFVGVLVERAVRANLDLRAVRDADL